jgi:hypothetical protein
VQIPNCQVETQDSNEACEPGELHIHRPLPQIRKFVAQFRSVFNVGLFRAAVSRARLEDFAAKIDWSW